MHTKYSKQDIEQVGHNQRQFDTAKYKFVEFLIKSKNYYALLIIVMQENGCGLSYML